MESTGSPAIRSLDRSECEKILRRNHIGRIAYTFQDRVDIEPISYVFDDGWIWGRTSHGEKFDVVQRNYWVAFEVDEVEDMASWRSVVVHGGFYPLDEDETEEQKEALERGLALLRRLLPETLRPEDPFPFRTNLFRIAAQTVSGRETSPGPTPGKEG